MKIPVDVRIDSKMVINSGAVINKEVENNSDRDKINSVNFLRNFIFLRH